jgi:hypothetical protein
MTSNKGMDNKNGKMVHTIKAITKVVKNKEMVHSSGVMIVRTKDNFYRTISMAKVNMYGKMVEYIKDNG